MTQALGILGTGALAAHLVTGLRAGGFNAEIIVSPRGANVAATLAAEHSVQVAASNQEVIDRARMVLVCLPAAHGANILRDLVFNAEHSICSAMAGLGPDVLSPLAAPASVSQVMMPGASNAIGAGPCLLFPAGQEWQALLAYLGPVLVPSSQAEYDIAAVFGALSGASFVLMQALATWFERRGIAPELARPLVAATLAGNAAVLRDAPHDWDAIIASVATPGGVTEQLVGALGQSGGLTAWDAGLDAVLKRMTKG
ncbi:pyrroline-5-carboxylate reductase dimerization domain-containing protein [Roseovarius arcticus]|uniref:pyrroline-5-carboxylate reductase dimerization domain-containing protein n=1 Tax=Roseovarius arcticus TaxID=2547404 RepID=UPI001486A25A|nr:pyrroline-5-carboxylate reductase dimerization domain-containing protein [Roseovarius arcticus]